MESVRFTFELRKHARDLLEKQIARSIKFEISIEIINKVYDNTISKVYNEFILLGKFMGIKID